MTRQLDHVEELIRYAEERGVQLYLGPPGMVTMIGPSEAVGELKPLVREHKPQLLERLHQNPWAWHTVPTDSTDAEALEWWAAVEHLREILAYEGWSLARVGRWLVIQAEPFFTEEKLKRLDLAVSGLRACWPVLVSKVEFFPELSPDQAKGLLDRIEKCHRAEGFRVLGWHGLEIPRAWPTAIWSMLYSCYAQSLQTEGEGVFQ